MRAIVGPLDSEVAELRPRLLDAASLPGRDRAVAPTELHGWLAYNKVATTSSQQVRARALVRALGTNVNLNTSSPAP